MARDAREREKSQEEICADAARAEELKKIGLLLEAKRLFKEAKEGGYNGVYLGPLVVADRNLLENEFEKNPEGPVGYLNGRRFAICLARDILKKIRITPYEAKIAGRGEGILLELINRESAH